ncbi:MAG: hypothetical protein IIX48_09150 [Lachnospiraceae bacterium]|nr:hypothetical protein [Lachnospiraceae bacterium]
MSYEYEHSVTYDFKKYKENKQIEFSVNTKTQLDNYYCLIRDMDKATILSNQGKLDEDKLSSLIAELSQQYASIRSEYIKPEVITKYKYKQVAYTQEEIDFIFACSYLLIDKYNLSQEQLAKVFGFRSNKFAKLGIFPIRCHEAYTKLEDLSNRKSLVPNNPESEGIMIARCINREVQAVYGCSAFVGISNMLDVFANISSTDTKAYVLTRPSVETEDNLIERWIAYPRFLFATANNLENVTNYKSRRYFAGKIKEEVISLLRMKDNKILKYSRLCNDLIEAGEINGDFISTGNTKAFHRELITYRNQVVLLADIQEGYYSSDYFEDTSCDEYGLDVDDINFDIADEDVLVEYLQESIQELREKLISKMSFAKVKYDTSAFHDYKMSMLAMLQEKYNLYSNYQSGMCNYLDDDEKVRLASIFWILEVLGLDETTEEKRESLLNYLKTKQLLGYVDSLNKETKKGGETHIYYEEDTFDVQSIVSRCTSKDTIHPVLLYIDGEAYKVTEDVLNTQLLNDNLVLVIRDRSDLAKKQGLKVLSEELDLYMWETNDGEN